jgi:hypothetical protein
MADALKGPIRDLERRHLTWMIGSLAVIWLLWVLALRLYPSQTDNQVVGTVFLVVSGILLGVGRQGIDVMGVRTLIASMAVLAAVPVRCSGFGECINAYEFGVPAVGFFGLVGFGLIALPINVLWNRGFSSLAPEFAWSRLSRLKWWQWALLGVTAFVVLVAYYLSLGIPAY